MIEVSETPFKLSELTNEDSDGNAMLKDHAYFAQSAGSVNAFVTVTAAAPGINGYIGFTPDPFGAGVKVDDHSDDTAGIENNLFFLVAKGEYFEVRSEPTGAVTIRWRSFGNLLKPVDFN